MSIPNSLTLLRIALTPVFVIFLFSESLFLKQLSLVVYIVAALTDWYDGVVARKYGYVSQWGKFWDPLADKILSSAALFSFVYLNLIDAWMVWIVVMRDVVITALRSLAEWREMPIITSKTAQAKTFSQFIVIYYVLIAYVAGTLPPIQDRYTLLLVTLMDKRVLFGMMLLVTISAIATGIMYLIDNRKFLRKLYGHYFGAEESN